MVTARTSMQMWIIWFMASFFYAYQYVFRVLPNNIMPIILEKFHIDSVIFGQYAGLYYIGYSAAIIPIGIMLDRIGPKIVLPVCIVLSVFGTLPLIYGDYWVYPIIGRMLVGIGSAGAILGVFKIIRMAFGDAKFTRMLGISVMIGLIGAIYGGRPVHYLLQTLGWEMAIYLICLAGLALAVIVYFLAPKHEFDQAQENRSVWDDIKTVFGNKKVIFICLLGGLMVGPLEGFADVWGTQFLVKVQNMEMENATLLPSFIYFGMLFGSPILSFIADKTKMYYSITILSALVMGAGFVVLLITQMNAFSLSVLFSIVGVMCAYQILVIYLASTYVEESLVGLTTAVANMIIMSFGWVFHSLIGKLMDHFSDGNLNVDGVPLYQADAFLPAISIIPIGLFIGAVGFILLKFREVRVK